MLRVAAASIVLASVAATVQLHSADFAAGSAIPVRDMAAGCGGENRSPELSWSGVPSGTKSLALILHDPDAPVPGGFYHWVAYNIAPTKRQLAASEKLNSSQLGVTTRGNQGYFGPCPPPGPAHHYVLTLYALDVAHLSASMPLTGSELEARIAGHVLTEGVLTGTETHH